MKLLFEYHPHTEQNNYLVRVEFDSVGQNDITDADWQRHCDSLAQTGCDFKMQVYISDLSVNSQYSQVFKFKIRKQFASEADLALYILLCPDHKFRPEVESVWVR